MGGLVGMRGYCLMSSKTISARMSVICSKACGGHVFRVEHALRGSVDAGMETSRFNA